MAGSRILNKEEIKSILTYLKRKNQRDYTCVLCSIHFGLRAQEVLTLSFSQVSGDVIRIMSLKGSNNDHFPIPTEVKKQVKKLKRYYQNKGIQITSDSYLFQSRNGQNQHLTTQRLNVIIRDTCDTLKISGKISNHSFRKTFITRCYKETNFDIIKTRRYSRHKSISSLQPYIEESTSTELIENFTWD